MEIRFESIEKNISNNNPRYTWRGGFVVVFSLMPYKISFTLMRKHETHLKNINNCIWKHHENMQSTKMTNAQWWKIF